MKSIKKPLALKKDVLRDLLPRELKRAAGGVSNPGAVTIGICLSDACTAGCGSDQTTCS
jgi:hypothetical protein